MKLSPKAAKWRARETAEALLAFPYGRARGSSKATEAYVQDRGPRAPPRLRYEAGVLVGLSSVGFRTECVYAESWEALDGAIRQYAQKDRMRGFAAQDWTFALLACLCAGTLDADNARQFAVWVEDAGAIKEE